LILNVSYRRGRRTAHRALLADRPPGRCPVTVVPSVTEPAPRMVPVAASRPHQGRLAAPEWPTRTTLRTASVAPTPVRAGHPSVCGILSHVPSQGKT